VRRTVGISFARLLRGGMRREIDDRQNPIDRHSARCRKRRQIGWRHNTAILLVQSMSMTDRKNYSRKRARKGKARLRVKPRRHAGSRVGDDLVAAFEEMAAHLRGEIELADVSPRR